MKCSRFLILTLCYFPLITGLWFSTSAQAVAEQEASQMAAGPGRDITVSTCSKCHSLANVTSQRKNRDGWNATITRMVGYGATGSDEDFAQILDYLAKNYGNDANLSNAVTAKAGDTGASQPNTNQGANQPSAEHPSAG